MKNEIAIFGGGCFWCTEAVFQRLRGVVKVTSGYSGGSMVNPNYYEVESGSTGHVQVVKIEFDPQAISYKDLLEVFWNVHNPTTPNQQGIDVGTQYRSIILYTSDKQKLEAEESMKKLGESKQYDGKIVTEIRKFDKFFDAETHHQDYYNKNTSEPYCQLVINPKLEKLKQKFATKLK